ncbi:hypothetical protein P691DRAFT_770235 [Macrolepiota fuliginosa MF-IS2]|uniref:NudC domain-containing protein 1 n=1 Tax=Macrolepiota fuliginosa MF-IS2 TaxID=1400762 RepID=A0A9P6C7F0_9AGAR|nr:hypothetical protein P691DRAFT_770235 [Macrolepiota fuliginosa MF-IS2]
MDSEIFRTEKSLLNPKFEGYKLHIIPQEEGVLQFPLANRPTQAATSGKVPLVFQEVQSRITHNHLVVHSEAGRAVYVDADYNIIIIELGQDRLSPFMQKIYELPKPIQTDAVDTGIHREYPSAAFFSPTSLLVSDGQGTMYALSLDEYMRTGDAVLIGKFNLPSGSPGVVDSPFRIHDVHRPSPKCVVATLSSRYYPTSPVEKPQGKHHIPAEFDVWGVKVNLMAAQTTDDPTPVEILWHRRGEDVPLYTTFDESRGLYLLVGGSEYCRLDAPPLPTYEPSPDEIAPIPRADETLTLFDAPSKPPPYSWTQSSDSITVAIPLSSTAPKDKIKVLFSSTTLTFHVDLDNLSTPQDVSVPRYSAKKLWGEISPSSSFWTFDREAERTYGVLSLHLEKQNEGTRWSHVFASAGTGSIAEEDIEVPETLDPVELWNIREALEKYTAAIQGEDTSGLGLGRGVPSLTENEVDEEVDFSVGRRAFTTWVPDPSLQIQPEFLAHNEYLTPFQLLSIPIPGQAVSDPVSLIIKNTIDGTVFTLDKEPFENLERPNWKHTATYPALAFVLASKRDTRFTHHIPGKAVLAFESGSSNRGGNVYIYYLAGAKDTTAKQSILKINDGRGGALLGVGLFAGGDGKSIIACLTEGELTLIRGV